MKLLKVNLQLNCFFGGGISGFIFHPCQVMSPRMERSQWQDLKSSLARRAWSGKTASCFMSRSFLTHDAEHGPIGLTFYFQDSRFSWGREQALNLLTHAFLRLAIVSIEINENSKYLIFNPIMNSMNISIISNPLCTSFLLYVLLFLL